MCVCLSKPVFEGMCVCMSPDGPHRPVASSSSCCHSNRGGRMEDFGCSLNTGHRP